MRAWLRALPAEALRVKALVTLSDSPDVRHLFERIGPDDFPPPTEVPLSDRVTASAILIGSGMDRDSLLSITREHLGETCTHGS